MGAPINTFNDFMTTTGPAILTGPDQVINEVSKQGGYCMSRFTMGKDSATLVQGGDRIRDVVMLDLESTYDHYQPNDTFSFRNPQSADYIEAFWRFSVDHMTWTDHEIELNVGGGSTVDSQVHTFKKLRKVKEMRLWTSMLNGMEDDLWRSPYGTNGFVAQQEPQAGKMQYSIPSFITENVTNTVNGERGGYPVSNVSSNGPVMRLNVFTEPRWTNQVSFYSSNFLHGGAQTSDTFYNGATIAKAAAAYTNHNANVPARVVSSLFGAMDDMWLKLKYEPPANRAEYFEKMNLSRQLILASRDGVNMYRRGLRQANDTLVSYQDPSYGNPQYSGIDVMYCSNLDTAAIFPAQSSALAYTATAVIGDRNGKVAGYGDTEYGSTTIDKGPRFWFVNGSYLTPVFHSNRYFKQHEVLRHPNQPFTYVQMYDCWWNLFCNSRQRHGIVAPLLT